MNSKIKSLNIVLRNRNSKKIRFENFVLFNAIQKARPFLTQYDWRMRATRVL